MGTGNDNLSAEWCCSLRDISRRWCSEAFTATDKVQVFSPYITSSRMIDRVNNTVSVEIYTSFSAEVFASGASAFSVVKKLFGRQGVQVFALADLHAKIVVIDKRFVSAGSQNLTIRGSQNLEVTLCNDDGQTADWVSAQVLKWTVNAVEITQEMMTAMEIALPPLRKMYKDYLVHVKSLNLIIGEQSAAAIAKRRETERLAATRAEALLRARSAYDSALDTFWNTSNTFFPDGDISEQFARWLALNCTWVSNSFGRGPCRLKSVGKKLFFVPGLGWCWNNSGKRHTQKFVMTLAVARCKLVVQRVVSEEWWIKGWDYDRVISHLKNTAWDCVANNQDEMYQGHYTRILDDLPFWGMSLDLSDLVRLLLLNLPLKPIYDTRQVLEKLKVNQA